MANLQEALGTFSALSKGLAGAMVGGYLLQLAAPSTRQVLALVAGRTLPCVWNVVTSGMLQDNLVSLVAFVSSLLFLSRIVEPLFGSREFLRFLLVSLAGGGALTFASITLCYYVATVAGAGGDRAASLLYLPVCGFQGGLAALLVALKQLIPDNEVTLLNVVHLRVRQLAGLYVAALLLASSLTGTFVKLGLFALFGAYTAWLYLRFFQPKGDAGLRGDPCEDFSLASFFPEAVQPAVGAVSAACTAVTRLGGGGSGSGGEAAHNGLSVVPPGGPDDASTARRRERGVRALEERLGRKTSTEQAASAKAGLAAALPDLEEGQA